MIGGEDVVIPLGSTGRAEALEWVVRSLRGNWEAAVFQDGDTGQCYATVSEIPFGRTQELLVYRDEAAFRDWEALGATASTHGSMVHVLARESSLTLVVDDAREPMAASVIAEARRLLAYGLAHKASRP